MGNDGGIGVAGDGGNDGGQESMVASGDRPLWARTFPCPQCASVQILGWPNGDVALGIGSYVEAWYVERMDPLGGRLWDNFVEQPANGKWANAAIAAGLDGALYADGHILPDPYVGVVGPWMIKKIDANGLLVWSRVFDLPQGSTFGPLAVAADGSISVFGHFVGTFDFGGGPIAASGPTNRGNLILRLDTNGQFLSADLFTQVPGLVSRVAVSATGLIATTGLTSGNDAAVALYDSTRQLLWSHTLRTSTGGGGDGDIRVSFVDDDVVVGLGVGPSTDLGDGPFGASVAVYGDAFAVARFDAAGHLLWKRGFVSDYYAFLSGLVVDSSGSIVLSGFVNRLGIPSFSFGSLTIPFLPGELALGFAGKFDRNGNAQWVRKIASTSPNATTSFSAPQVEVDGMQAVRIAGINSSDSVLYVSKYAP